MNTLPFVSMAVMASIALASSALADELSDLLTDAQRTYVRGDLSAAKEKFELVRKLDPNNRTAFSYLKRIAGDEMAQAGKGTPNGTEAALNKIVIESVSFSDATLVEALEFLRQKGNQLGEGKVAINFVYQLDEKAKAARITLNLQKLPFTEVLRYVGELAGTEFKFERYAIVVRPKGPAKAPRGEADASQPQSRVKIEGL